MMGPNKIKKYLLCCILLFASLLSHAQAYKYIGIDEGLSNRRVYAIQKDAKGYMWFLTSDGIDRYDGKNFKSYKMEDPSQQSNSRVNLTWIFINHEGELWGVSKKGHVFSYNRKHDTFQLEHKLNLHKTLNGIDGVSYGCIDQSQSIWLCTHEAIYQYNTLNKTQTRINHDIDESITDIAQIDSTHFFIGTDIGIHYTEMDNGVLRKVACNKLENLLIQVNELYYHRPANKVFVGTFQRGMFVYDLNQHMMMHLNDDLLDISINHICAFNDHELLIATDGAGVFKMNTDNYECHSYIAADYNQHNAMNGNTINDIYIDGDRIWMANYPIGITIRNNKLPAYKWFKHYLRNNQSLTNNHVNTIIEDTEGDLWFATNNGISLYNIHTQRWHSFLNSANSGTPAKNNIFLTLCEVSPGIIWAGGYNSGIYEIDKRRLSVEFFTPSLFSKLNIRPDKYIRSIVKTSDGMVWSGGYYNLKEIDYVHNSIRYFPELPGVTVILEKDAEHMWVGSTTGLYLLEKNSGHYKQIDLPVESYHIYSLYQTQEGLLYIGTNNAGLLIYNAESNQFKHYHERNSALISNNIYSILSADEESFFLSTEHGLSKFNPTTQTFQNWTRKQGLQTEQFNATSGTCCKNGSFIFGSTDGAIAFNKDITLPTRYDSKMVFSDLRVFYRTVYPKDEGSPLVMDIDESQTLRLKYKQNIFSLQVSSINYDYPSLVLYSWKLEGFYDGWSSPSRDNTIRFTNLNPGRYILHVRALSSEDPRIVLEERNMTIIIEEPIWMSLWAMIVYVLIALALAGGVLRLLILRKKREESDEKIRFFVNTAHDLRTPLTLIKAPLEEMAEHEELSKSGRDSMNAALRNVNSLLRLTTNLINFERTDTYNEQLRVSEYELGEYIEEIVDNFLPYAEVKHIHLSHEKNFEYLNVWLDKEKVDSILKNLLSNALKYTPEEGKVHVKALATDDYWCIEVKDTGIGIPASEQKKLFKMHFRGSNAINSKITGSGIGLLLVWKLVRMHKGKLTFHSIEGEGSTVRVCFPRSKKKYNKAIVNHADPHPNTMGVKPETPVNVAAYVMPKEDICVNTQTDKTRPAERLMIVEDNDELRTYLHNTLQNEYNIVVCANGVQGLNMARSEQPDIIISDIMMPEMNGDEMCRILKTDINTSHIPIILLTALNSDHHIIKGLQTGADEYIVKPFNIGVLRATIENLLANRRLLRIKYANLELNDEQHDTSCINCSNDLDWKFIATVKQHVEENMTDPNFNVDMLCTLMNMSRTSFYNKIKALTDESPADYIRLIKLQRAAELLLMQQYTVTEVSELTGFNDAKYFREVFKKYFNISPSQYAKHANLNEETQ